MGNNRVARQSFGVFKIHKNHILFGAMSVEEETRRKKDRRKKMNKIQIFKLGFSKLLKVSGTFGVDIALEYYSLKLFELLCLDFPGVVPIPYV